MDKYLTVRFDRNHYSVPRRWAFRAVTVKGYVDRVEVVGEYIQLNLIRNAGAAFSIGNSATWLLTIVAFGVLVFIVRTARRIGSTGWAWALGLLLGGSVGNLTDRMVRAPGPGRGHVVDFIDYFGWFVGNVADIAICVGVGLMAIDMFSARRRPHLATSHSAPSPQQTAAMPSAEPGSTGAPPPATSGQN